MEVSDQIHAPAALSPGKEPLLHIGQDARWAPEPVWTRWWKEIFPALYEIKTPDHPTCSPTLNRWAIQDNYEY